MWSREYHIDAENKDDAINKILIGDWKDINIKDTPFIYPFITNDVQLREKLIKNKVYIAKYWIEVLDRDDVSNVEIDFVDKLMPLPIDQRYSLDDMCRILKIIKDNA